MSRQQTTQVKRNLEKAGIVVDSLTCKNGVYTAKQTFYYGGGRTSQQFADAITRAGYRVVSHEEATYETLKGLTIPCWTATFVDQAARKIKSFQLVVTVQAEMEDGEIISYPFTGTYSRHLYHIDDVVGRLNLWGVSVGQAGWGAMVRWFADLIK
jgi:hypothetical protein